MRSILVTGDGTGAGASWRPPVDGCELQEGRLELGGELHRVFRLRAPWATYGIHVVEVLVVPAGLDLEQLAVVKGVKRVQTPDAAKWAAEFTWPTDGGLELELPLVAGGMAPAALEGLEGDDEAIVAIELEDEKLTKTKKKDLQ